MSAATDRRFAEMLAGGGEREIDRAVPVESPVAIEINGLSYAVMMATPADLEDFATGFAITERLATHGPPEVQIAQVEHGCIARLTVPTEAAAPILDRARARVSDSSCGLCGIESLEALARPLPRIAEPLTLDPTAIFAALAALPDHQPRGRQTRAMHAAAFCSLAGQIVMVREDVGRHNALDKLIGAMARSGQTLANGFVLTTARCSYELVEKTVLAGGRALVSISAATSMALDRAAAAGLGLYPLARDDSVLRA